MIDEKKAMKELVAKGIKIPPQPKVLLDLNRKLASDNYDVRALAKIELAPFSWTKNRR